MNEQPGTSGVQQRTVSVFKYLRETSNSSIPLELKCDLKDKRPTPNLNLKTVSEENSHKPLIHRRFFQSTWYSRFPWLAGCNEEKKMYCFKCLLLGSRNLEWCLNGISNLGNFIRKAEKHQSSELHLANEEKFHFLGRTQINYVLSEASRLQALKYNEEVKSNREVLGRIIQAVIYLCKNELPLRGHHEDENSTNKGNYLSLLDLLAQKESVLRDHLSYTSSFKGTSPGIQNDLIEAITAVLNEKISTEIQQSHFVSVQADETLDVSCKSQMSIIFRYFIKDRIEERFVGFYDVSEQKNAVGLSKVVIDVLKKWGIPGDKVVSQTYDGAAVMAGSDSSQIIEGTENNVQHLVRQEYCPHALFIHCYAHQLNLVMLHGSKKIKEAKLFICQLTSFHSFFSKSSKQTTLLTDKGFKLPQAISTQWNFHTRAVSTIIKFFTELYQVLDSIIEDVDEHWDSNSIICATGLKLTMDKPTFVFLLFVYEACFLNVDHCFLLLQSICTSITTCRNELHRATEAIGNLRRESFIEECFEKSTNLNNALIFTDKDKQRLKILTYEILDTVVNQMKLRFSDLGKLNFLDLVNEKFFSKFHKCAAPVKENLTDLLKHYPFFDGEKLQNELHNIYSDNKKHLPPQKLLVYLISTGLDSIYSQVVKLLQLILTFPATSTSRERSMSTLKRVKTHLRNSMTDTRLSNLSTLAVEEKLLSELSYDPSFISRVIDIFAEQKNRMDLLYKAV